MKKKWKNIKKVKVFLNPSEEKKLYLTKRAYYNISDLEITKEIEQKFVPMKQKEKEIEKVKDRGIER